LVDNAARMRDAPRARVRTLLNIVWFVLAGLWLALAYGIAGLILCITIIGIPFGVQSFKLAGYALWPFGRVLVPSPTRLKGLSVIANILWFILAGWWLALAHLLTGILLCLTIIGIPLGVADFKMAGAALVPFGKEIVRTTDLAQPTPGAISVSNGQ
jgi:uncharacterized membrane protein YccF (DUF307 family)